MIKDNFLDKFNNSQIMVVGDVILDKYIFGEIKKISLDAPVPVVSLTDESFSCIGGAGNVANTVCALGGKSILVGIYSEDTSGVELDNKIKITNIDNKCLKNSTNRKTTTKTRILASTIQGFQQVLRMDSEHHHILNMEEEESLLSSIIENSKNTNAFILQNYNKGTLTDKIISNCIKISNRSNKFIAVDPKEENFEKYKGCNLIKPNIKEAEYYLRNKIQNQSDLSNACKIIQQKTKADIVIITLGKNGMFTFTKNKSYLSKTISKFPVDPTGAGENVIAAFVLAFINGASLEQATEIASTAASISVEKLGVNPVTMLELKKRLTALNKIKIN